MTVKQATQEELRLIYSIIRRILTAQIDDFLNGICGQLTRVEDGDEAAEDDRQKQEGIVVDPRGGRC